MPSDILEKPKPNSPPMMSDEGVEEIREAVKAIIVHEDMRATEIATASGVKYGTLSVWLTGKYTGRNDRVAFDLQRWLDTREARKKVEMIAPRAPAFVFTKTAEAVMALLRQAQHMPDMAICVGAPGVGKTSAACHYTKTNSNVWKITANPSVTSPRAVLQELCRVLGLYGVGMQSKVMRAICDRVRGTGGLIIIDEAQHLTPDAHDLVRSIHDDADIGVALLGNEAIHTRLEGDGKRERFAQLTSRIGVRINKPRALKSDIDALLSAWSVEGAAERALLHAVARKPGALRLMSKTLKLAHMMAGQQGVAISAPLIRSAFSSVSTDVLAQATEEAA
jgi:DNA transposition AAA+ family ATPase